MQHLKRSKLLVMFIEFENVFIFVIVILFYMDVSDKLDSKDVSSAPLLLQLPPPPLAELLLSRLVMFLDRV